MEASRQRDAVVSSLLLPPRSMVGQQILDLLIGVRIPGGQPIATQTFFLVSYNNK